VFPRSLDYKPQHVLINKPLPSSFSESAFAKDEGKVKKDVLIKEVLRDMKV